jgi:hypothetical protein
MIMSKWIIIISFFVLRVGNAQITSYTFQVNQTCTSCCTASACVSLTFSSFCPIPPISGYALITPTTTTPVFTLNPCFNNLCNGIYTMQIQGIQSPSSALCGINMYYPAQTTSLNENKKQIDLSISPNPAKDHFKIILNTEIEGIELTIANLLGQTERIIENDSSKHYTITGLKPGVYFVVLKTNNVLISRKKLIISD